MDSEICKNFIYVTTKFPDKLDTDGKYYFNDDGHFKQYCSNQNCVNELEKISAGCLYLFDTFFKDSSVFESVAKSNINIVDYIIIWLSYMLNLKPPGTKSHLEHFYETNINNDKYTKPIDNVEGCSNYKALIDKTNLMNMDIKYISKFYEIFKLLCEMYTEFDESKKNCAECSKKASQFASKFKELSENSDITSNSPYNKVLCILSNDYNKLKKKCNDSSLFPTIDKTKITIKCPEQFSEVTSSSSTANKLFIVLSIFGAIAIFLGISYKYSLFGFRKRFQKQKLREKIKNIKKRMNH
ncbi:PIR protein [Plasmodium yoelii]|uniref:PIR protein n=2 Tax=Plasmodium yoelii TaxID=5861 RepID=A0AAE9WM45_PLAYO|nr:PIR protein [Plasmodium yoelii]WBY54879.1 PIR protein [Plasmodium yoelii yoelii]CDS44074.1 YIR protein [Plasmodium yoelii]VTZ71904.1 PIR protein [Plasmodium yoelii]|eukprot:XP_022810769.1 PIR protein [Plasmodium yoelii]